MWEQVEENSEGTGSAGIITCPPYRAPHSSPKHNLLGQLLSPYVMIKSITCSPLPSIYFGITVSRVFLHSTHTYSVDLVIKILSISDMSEFIKDVAG